MSRPKTMLRPRYFGIVASAEARISRPRTSYEGEAEVGAN